MASSVKFYSNSVEIGSLALGNDPDKYAGVAGTYLDMYYIHPDGTGLTTGQTYDPATDLGCYGFVNNNFTDNSFETLSSLLATKLAAAETVEVALIQDGVEVKRKTISQVTYWLYIDGGKFQEKSRCVMAAL
jgi:hypothetical protein